MTIYEHPGELMARHDTPILFAVPDITDADVEAVAQVMRSGWITTGDQCRLLEEELATYLDVPHVVSMSSCTAAIETAVAYLGLPAGARVGVPTWTFVSTALAPAHHGLHPVLIDVEPDTLNLKAAALADALDEGLDLVIAVHFAGVPVSQEIHKLCAAAGVPLIEDAAHALGAIDPRGRIAGQGTAGACFSFYATKNLTSGEGGALATTDDDLADFARSFRLHGMSRDAWARYHPGAPSSYDLEVPGIKGNLPDMLAALARSQFQRYELSQSHRRALVTRYRTNLAGSGVTFVPGEPDAGSADHLVVVVLPEGTDRDPVVASLNDRGVSTSVHFRPLHDFTWFKQHALVGPGGTPVADRLQPRVLSLPLHTGLHSTDVDRVCEALLDTLAP